MNETPIACVSCAKAKAKCDKKVKYTIHSLSFDVIIEFSIQVILTTTRYRAHDAPTSVFTVNQETPAALAIIRPTSTDNMTCPGAFNHLPLGRLPKA